jgi:hypothetical protein
LESQCFSGCLWKILKYSSNIEWLIHLIRQLYLQICSCDK